jgi:hypothetical protein
MAAMGMVVMAGGGCAGIQTARLAAPPDFSAVEHTAGLADLAANRTVRASGALLRQTALAAKTDARVAALGPAAATVARDAQQTQAATRATVAALKPALKTQARFVASARAVQAGELHNAARYKAISHSLSYKLGRFIVITVFLLLVAGGLILFSESGWAGVLGMKFPLLAAALFKPLEYLGTLLGKLWGYVENTAASLWRALAGHLMPHTKTAS